MHAVHLASLWILSHDKNIVNLQVWKSILERSGSDDLGVAVAPLFQSMAWMWLLVAPYSSPIELNLLVPPSPGATVCTCTV